MSDDSPSTPAPVELFDRRAVRLHRDRAAAAFGDNDFLLREVAGRLQERLGDVRRDFPKALHFGHLAPDACQADGSPNSIRADLSPNSIRADLSPAMTARGSGTRMVADTEWLPLADNSLDLVTSLLTLHWTNDLPGALVQIRRALRPDGLFMAAMFGGETLHELRLALAEAEAAEEGGVSPRISPMADLRDMGALLQRAGFALPVADIDSITVSYDHAFALMHDLRAMGETNALHRRRKHFTRRATLMAAADIYRDKFADGARRLPATFQIIWLTAWAPDDSQPRPQRPGSARSRLADALGAPEIPTGDKARPG